MADSKITALTALTAADPVNDMFPVVDVSDTSMAASGTTKRISINNILACSPSATLASATITGDLTVDTSTLKVDSTNNRVGIGTASPTGIFHAANLGTAGTTADNFNGYFSSANRNSSVYILAKNTEGSNLYLGDGDSNTVGAVIYDHTSNYMRFDVNGAEAARFNSTANLVLKGGTSGANGVGVTFPATQVDSSNANCLDDYEEGTFTPTIYSGATGITYGTQSGSYTKVGRSVTVTVHLSTTAATVNGSQLTITGFPFASSDFGAGVIGYSSSGFVSTPSGNKPNLYFAGSQVDFYTSSGSAFLGTTLGSSIFDVRFTATFFT